VGAFEVDARFAGGRVLSLAIRSLKGNECRVVHPWPGQDVLVVSEGMKVATSEVGDEVRFGTRAGVCYTLAPEGVDTHGEAGGKPDEAAEPMAYAGPAYLWDVAADKRIRVSVGLQ
jgi:hypothetical protein